MNIIVAYHSVTGKTKKVAEAVARELGLGGAAEVKQLKDELVADLLFVGGAVYADQGHDLHPELVRFLTALDSQKVKQVAVFATGFSPDNGQKIRRVLEGRGVKVLPEAFYCRGQFLLFNFGHPNQADLAAAAVWARQQVLALT